MKTIIVGLEVIRIIIKYIPKLRSQQTNNVAKQEITIKWPTGDRFDDVDDIQKAEQSVSCAAEALQSGVVRGYELLSVTWWGVQSVTTASVVTANGCGSW